MHLRLGTQMATMVSTRAVPDAAASTIERDAVLQVIELQARLLNLSAREAIDRVKRQEPVRGYIWDDIALLVSLLQE